MSPPSLHAMRRMDAQSSPTPGLRRPSAARMKTVRTKALEMGFQSEMPSEMPLTSTNRKQRPTATARKNTGWCNTWLPSHTMAAPQNRTHSTRRSMLMRFQSSAGLAGSAVFCWNRRAAWIRISARSRMAAPRMVPSEMIKPILRNGSSGFSQPMLTR